MSDHSPERRKGAKLFNGFVLRSVTTLSSQMLSNCMSHKDMKLKDVIRKMMSSLRKQSKN
uniref:Uncharacterized protein n=1 Tax=Rhizophora mucronata TaxID=61149 RepID=A0A2P2MH96_RHIMU